MNSKTQILTSISEAIAGLAESASHSLVQVSAGRRGGGTGIIWSSDGQIVTCSHVVAHAGMVEVSLPDGRRLSAKILGQDPYADIALLKVEADGLTPLARSDSEKLQAGQFVLAVADAFGPPVSVTSGIITSPKRSLRGWWGHSIEDAIITDAPLNPGYSGGPLLDAEGGMIGLNAAFFASRGISIPVRTVAESVERLQTDGRIKRAYLGIMTQEMELPEELGEELKQDSGLLVARVLPDTPARKAGLLMGDVILQLNEQATSSLHDLNRLLIADVLGKKISLKVLRGEKQIDLNITPVEASD